MLCVGLGVVLFCICDLGLCEHVVGEGVGGGGDAVFLKKEGEVEEDAEEELDEREKEDMEALKENGVEDEEVEEEEEKVEGQLVYLPG